jgi:hypothetical protein
MNKKRLPEQTWQNRIVSYGEQPANQFLAHELNARRHPGKQRDALRGSLNAVGWVAPVIVSAQTGKILDGHARVEEALSEDEHSLVPFVEVDVSENEERTILASFDPITGLATYDREALDALLREVSTGEAALQEMLADLAVSENLIPSDDNQHETRGRNPEGNLSAYVGDGIKQIVFYCSSEQYASVISALDAKMAEHKTDSHSAAILAWLEIKDGVNNDEDFDN